MGRWHAGGPAIAEQNEIAITPRLPPGFRLPPIQPPRYVRQSPHIPVKTFLNTLSAR